MQVACDCDHNGDRHSFLMATADEQAHADGLSGQLALNGHRRLAGNASAVAPSAIHVALAPVAAPGSAVAPTTIRQPGAIIDEIGAMPAFRLIHAGEGQRADVVLFTDASLPSLARAARTTSDHVAPNESGHRPAIVVITEREAAVARLLRAIAPAGWAVLPTTVSPAALAAAITAAAQGLAILPTSQMDLPLSSNPAPDHAVMEATRDTTPSPTTPDAPALTPTLTARERETLELLSDGLSNKLIARRLGISEHTVKFHISALYAKLGAGSRAEAVSRAARRGVLTLNQPKAAPTA